MKAMFGPTTRKIGHAIGVVLVLIAFAQIFIPTVHHFSADQAPFAEKILIEDLLQNESNRILFYRERENQARLAQTEASSNVTETIDDILEGIRSEQIEILGPDPIPESGEDRIARLEALSRKQRQRLADLLVSEQLILEQRIATRSITAVPIAYTQRSRRMDLENGVNEGIETPETIKADDDPITVSMKFRRSEVLRLIDNLSAISAVSGTVINPTTAPDVSIWEKFNIVTSLLLMTVGLIMTWVCRTKPEDKRVTVPSKPPETTEKPEMRASDDKTDGV